MLRVRDSAGRVLCYLDADDARPRDDSGKVIAQRAGDDRELAELSRVAYRRMYDAPVQLDLAPGDVMQPATRADFGIPRARDYLADQVSPIVFVSRDRGEWYTENVADGIKLVVAIASLTGQQPEINPGFTATAFSTQGYAVAAKLSKRLCANADFDLRKRAVRYLVDVIKRARESRVATQLTTPGNWAPGNRIAAAAKWNLASGNPSPLQDLFKALAASYLPADTLVLPEIAAQYFHYSGGTGLQVRDFVQGGGQLPRILYARALQLVNGAPGYVWMPTGLGPVPLVRTTVYDAWWEHHAKDRAPLEHERVPEWAPVDQETDVGSSATFRWRDGDAGIRVNGILVRQYDDGHDVDTEWITVAVNDAEVQPSNQVGALITGALA